jgi:hypothetical protein
MSFVLGLIAVSSCVLVGQEEKSSQPQRDRQSIEILTRVLQNSGGSRALAAVHDITETGEIQFYSKEGAKGSVTIRILDGTHFRLEADLPQEKETWVVKEGVGSQTQGAKTEPISRERAIALANLTLPVRHLVAALADGQSEISFVGIEKRGDRSLYRVRVKGRLGLLSKNNSSLLPVTKDFLIDALTFDIVSIGDSPFLMSKTYRRKQSAPSSHEIEFADFHLINGVRLPFSIVIIVFGQETLGIRLTQAIFNTNLREQDFEW